MDITKYIYATECSKCGGNSVQKDFIVKRRIVVEGNNCVIDFDASKHVCEVCDNHEITPHDSSYWDYMERCAMTDFWRSHKEKKGFDDNKN